MAFNRDMWAEAADKRKKTARRAFAGATLCSIAAAGTGYTSTYFTKKSLDNLEYMQRLEKVVFSPFTGASANAYVFNAKQEARTNSYTNGGIGLGALLATCALAVGAVRLYKRFRYYSALVKQARSATRMIDRRGG